MIKLSRGACPSELTDDVRDELTKLYAANKNRDVWNSPKIKEPLKRALLDMSHSKCSYCECTLNIESKDVTIDHFIPKSINAGKVVEWENLFPTCLRCNRKKNDSEEVLINPCKEEPRKFLALCRENPFRLKGMDAEGVGKKTIKEIGLNDPIRVMGPRMEQWEDIHQRMEDICEDINDEGYKDKYRNRLKVLMEKCTEDNAYSAIKASNMLEDSYYKAMKDIIVKNGKWTDGMSELEEEMKKVALQFI